MRAVPVDDKMTVAIKKVGVIGSGQMGNGIAHVAALAGFDVALNDVSGDRLKSALATINGNLTRQVAKKAISETDRKQALDRITSAETIDALADCDLVIETAVEKEETKRKIFHDVCAVLKPDAIVATNSSSISITRLAASTDRPEKFIGIHFMNPVPAMELVELIRGIATDDATFDAEVEIDADELEPDERSRLMRSAGKMIDEGSGPDVGNYQQFEPVVGPGGKLVALRFVFPPYQVGPYSDGVQTVEVPAAVLLSHVAERYRGLFVQG